MNDLEYRTHTPPMRMLRDAFTARRILNYREGDFLVVNDPYLRTKVEISFNGGWFVWSAPGGAREYGDPARVTDVVDRVIYQYAGIHFESR